MANVNYITFYVVMALVGLLVLAFMFDGNDKGGYR
jgi:hypothetical protein